MEYSVDRNDRTAVGRAGFLKLTAYSTKSEVPSTATSKIISSKNGKHDTINN